MRKCAEKSCAVTCYHITNKFGQSQLVNLNINKYNQYDYEYKHILLLIALLKCIFLSTYN